MYTLLLLLLFTIPAIAGPASAELCEEIREVLAEQVKLGYINEQEADKIYGSCAGHLEISP